MLFFLPYPAWRVITTVVRLQAQENRMLGVQKTHDPGTAAGTRMAAPARVEQASPGTGAKLLDRLREALRCRHYSRRTEQTYCHWVKRFIYFHNVRHPADMGEPEINAFLTHLAVKQKVSASTQNQALSALLFPNRSRPRFRTISRRSGPFTSETWPRDGGEC